MIFCLIKFSAEATPWGGRGAYKPRCMHVLIMIIPTFNGELATLIPFNYNIIIINIPVIYSLVDPE